ncbi:RodZ domain-containing protein [Marinobacter lacisalsi]|uniref:RodZ domain-containing protein n=1 Tax=Marinobacter lacisalsi TaxID=475979 RepID=A0ABV8QHA0_9GAMM
MTTDNASQDTSQPTVGERLRQARETVGLSVAEVAAKQHLRPAIISAIESGDYRRIDSELFLKGYVRAYATHVGIDPDSVVRQLDKELEPMREERQARVEASPLVTIERRKRRKRQIAKIVSVLLALAVLFYVGALYLATQEPPAGSATDDPVTDESDGTEALVPAEPTDNGGSVSDDDTLVEAPLAASEPTEDEGVDQESAIPDEVGDASPGAAEPAETDTAPLVGTADPSPQTSLQPVPEPDSVADTRAEPPAESSPPPEPDTVVPADNQGRLVVEFSGDCWVEVQDSTGRTLVAELRRSGETLDVTGNGPLRVVLGAVSAVSALSYSGEPVNLADRRARNDRLVLNLSD